MQTYIKIPRIDCKKQTMQGVIFMKDYIEERAVEIAYYIIEHKVTNRKYKVYNFVENY